MLLRVLTIILQPYDISWEKLFVAQPCCRLAQLSGDVVIVLGRTVVSIGGAVKLPGPTSADTDRPSNFGGNFANVKPVPDCVVYAFDLGS